MVHFKTIIRRPMPVQDIPSLCKPSPLCFIPKSINNSPNPDFNIIIPVKILSCRQKPLKHERTLHNISSIIFRAERYSFTGRPVYPMSPHTMITCCFILKKIYHRQQPFSSLLTSNKTSFYTYNQGHYSKARTSDSYRFGSTVGAFPCQTANRMSIVPKITESLFLCQVQQFLICEHTSSKALDNNA